MQFDSFPFWPALVSDMETAEDLDSETKKELLAEAKARGDRAKEIVSFVCTHVVFCDTAASCKCPN